MRLLVTGATGKVGQNVLAAPPRDARFAEAQVVALCHNRGLSLDGVEVVNGSIASREDVARAMAGVTHVLHLAAVKESPDLAIDVAVKGMFLLLEAFRQSETAERFVLLGGDCAVGHIFQPYDSPITEESPRRAYPGCYALTKVIEEVMLEQYRIQYGIDTCCIRAPWIMEKDDFRFAMVFGPDQFGGPAWADLMPQADLERAWQEGLVPLMIAANGEPLRRSFVHVDDVVSAALTALVHPAAAGETFNITMNEPVDYGRLAALLKRRNGTEAIEIRTPFHGNWLDNSKARQRLGWAPDVDLEEMIERAWTYQRAEKDVRRVWYPG
ncbi:NAD-dependent epimerase/dehydratase family protein [Seohaeicola nanhaiensis]|uniref:NAD-dependent epimerase/dehydratase family protein n=1 Tax=Seohaeicola nanhaiensis TaxID=1387282 RepID=A0ABV9KDG7_9RHOB